ncbi:hypothetical protein [Blastopirellula marina]|uniref:Uncharacterized protein n=1 Tax=Blastopirellula marina TaxID=124 RepID=A0A2S8G8E0_9BACT|nr:hypothetical protein [Blastopirellula marina]PQO40716.1 hypothetical protein C5Y98_05720 [Blastopirellula marina]PTL45676.1 hypothetical protein C5Y97_05720 [Blastopirellula marina]
MNLRTCLKPSWFLPALAITLATGVLATNARAQMLYSDSEPAPRDITYKFEIGPKSPQPPIMKYRLLPAYVELMPGNAAPLYHRAILLTSRMTANMQNSTEYWTKVDEYRSIPLAEFPIAEVEKVIANHESALREATYAARRSYCDWDLPTREHGIDLFGVLLPEIQEMRTLARLLALRIRLRIAQGRLDEAMKDLQTGYAMARHVGNRDFLVNALVGIAIAGMMHEQLLVAISQESTPNLYWSLVNFPTPLIDITNAVDVERDSFLVIFPELTEATKDVGDQAFWDQKLLDVIARRDYLNSGQTIDPNDTPSTEMDWEKWAIRSAIFSQVPRVKQELVEDMGYDAAAVEAMPGSRALLIYSRNNFERIRDELLAPLGLPYYQARKFYADNNKLFPPPIVAGDPLGIASVILPAITQVDLAEVRSECWVDMLQITEAIRDYAATHGSLPESLDQLEALPIPMNPYTNQPFLYSRQKDNPLKATLEEADSHLPQRFEITLRKP